MKIEDPMGAAEKIGIGQGKDLAASAGYNFRLLLNWLRLLLYLIAGLILLRSSGAHRLQIAWKRIVHSGLPHIHGGQCRPSR